MNFNFIILLGFLTFIQSTLGGLLHGEAFSRLTSPNIYNFGRIASYSPQNIANPVAASYSTRFTAYTAVPLTASVGTFRHASGGLVRAFAAPQILRHSGLSSPQIRQGVVAYAAVPIAGYRASFGGPALRNYGATLGSLNNHGIYATAGFDDYADSVVVNDQRAFGAFGNENPLSVW